jgi:probable rRNA maturation factor
MTLEFFSQDIEMPEIPQDNLRMCIQYLIQNEGFIGGDINVIYCSDNALLEMNRNYLQHDYYTDIITFDYVEDKIISGDLFISWDRLNENALEFADSLIQEIFRLIIHGVLHLCGYKDKTDNEQHEMRSKEDLYLQYASENNLID